jgi:phospholipid transport system substrate-binding protein
MNNKTLQRRDLGRLVLAGALLFGAAVAFVQPARAADEAPDALV